MGTLLNRLLHPTDNARISCKRVRRFGGLARRLPRKRRDKSDWQFHAAVTAPSHVDSCGALTGARRIHTSVYAPVATLGRALLSHPKTLPQLRDPDTCAPGPLVVTFNVFCGTGRSAHATIRGFTNSAKGIAFARRSGFADSPKAALLPPSPEAASHNRCLAPSVYDSETPGYSLVLVNSISSAKGMARVQTSQLMIASSDSLPRTAPLAFNRFRWPSVLRQRASSSPFAEIFGVQMGASIARSRKSNQQLKRCFRGQPKCRE